MKSSGPLIFLSYAREDVAAARDLRRDLETIGARVWFDETSLLPGQKWKREIASAIRQSEFFIALLSQHSVTKRGVVQQEVREALEVMRELPEDAVFILPVRLEEVTPSHEALNALQRVDLFPDWTQGVRRISLAVFARSSTAAEPITAVSSATLLGLFALAADNYKVDIRYRLPPHFEDVVVSVTQLELATVITELIANVASHGATDALGIRSVDTNLRLAHGALTTEVKNRVTVSSSPVGDYPAGFGLSLMQQTVRRNGGRLLFSVGHAAHQHTFTATLTLPVVVRK